MRNNWEIISYNDLTWVFFHRHIQPSKRTDITLLIPVFRKQFFIYFFLQYVTRLLFSLLIQDATLSFRHWPLVNSYCKYFLPKFQNSNSNKVPPPNFNLPMIIGKAFLKVKTKMWTYLGLECHK